MPSAAHHHCLAVEPDLHGAHLSLCPEPLMARFIDPLPRRAIVTQSPNPSIRRLIDHAVTLSGHLFDPAFYSRPDPRALNPAIDIWLPTKLAKARAFALACRPVGKTAHRSTVGSDQSSSTEMTAPDFSSGANNPLGTD